MKVRKYFTYMAIIFIAILTGCSKDNHIQLTISQNELNYVANGGEQILSIESNFNFEYDYNASWLLVRQQQGKMRIIVDPNNDEEVRTANIKFLYHKKTIEEVTIHQEGVSLSIENNVLSIASKGENTSIPISCNIDWSIEYPKEEWYSVSQENSNIEVSFDRNYQMKDRSATLTVIAGNLKQDINITQSASKWFESFEMVRIDEGAFYMGAQKNYPDSYNYDTQAYQIESPVHKVNIDNYAICKYEVTQQQWMAAMGYNPSSIIGEKLPVETVSWNQVQEFISILNQASGLNYRLPTEAEWEFAARGGAQSDGFKYSGYSAIGACAWYYSNSESTTHEVGTKNPNELGIYDMTGNVREWCSDWFDYYTSSNDNNPQGPYYGSTKINRGGSWTTPSINCRNSYRHTNFPEEAAQDLGFRLVLSIE